jgi:hypothetical protein
MDHKDLADLKFAVGLLENPSVGAKIANAVGSPVEKAMAMLPHKAHVAIGSAVQKAVHAALKLALKTLRDKPDAGKVGRAASADWWHLAASAATGGVGGAFGLAALALELPLTTSLILRSIADVARSEGADLHEVQTQLECVQVLAFGGPSRSDDGTDVGYFVAREALAKAVADAAAHIARHGVQKEAAPAVLRLVLQVAQRYSITVTEKAAAQLVPLIGAAGGAVVNTVFMDHFQSVARGHFILRRLELRHGPQIVREHYLRLQAEGSSRPGLAQRHGREIRQGSVDLGPR